MALSSELVGKQVFGYMMQRPIKALFTGGVSEISEFAFSPDGVTLVISIILKLEVTDAADVKVVSVSQG